RPRALSALQPGISAVQLAALVGVWGRGAGRFRVPLHGPAALGAGPARAVERGGGGWAARSPGIHAAVADRALRASGARGQAARETFLVSRGQTTAAA